MGLCELVPQRHLTAARDYQLAALAPFPAPRLRPSPWDFDRRPLRAAALVHYYGNIERRRVALTQPPPRAGVANATLHLNKTIQDREHHADRVSAIVPAPCYLVSVTSTFIIGGFSTGSGWVEIPELGYFRWMDNALSTGAEANLLLPLGFEIAQPVTLVAAYQLNNDSGASQVAQVMIQASLSYRPLAA